MIRTSIWEKRHFLPHYDVIIVGAGLIGLCSALELRSKSKSLKILVIDRASIPLGASTRNAGFACFGSPSEILADLKNHSFDHVCQLIKKRYDGWNLLLNLVGRDQLKYEPTGGYEVFRDSDEQSYAQCQAIIDPINDAIHNLLGIRLYQEWTKPLPQVNNFAHIIAAPHEGLIDPGSMMKKLLEMIGQSEIDFYGGLACEELVEQTNLMEVKTSRGKLTANQVILATNGFAQNLVPDSDITAVRNQILVTSPLKNCIQGAFHYDRGYYYFRNIGSRILIGGGRNIALEEETTNQFDITEKIRRNLQQFLKSHLIPTESYQIEYEWSGILGFGKSKIPQVKRKSSRLVMAAGMGGMGIAIGAAIAQDAAHEILC